MSAYGMDDTDDDDNDCPLCLDPLGDDIRFKPCNCGYQICRFCWHHIKTNLNGRCPACRKVYSDETVEFTPMQPEELKRLNAAKKQRDREKRDADTLSKKHAANVRVRQRAQVHIQGMTTKIANEDTLPALKGPEQFGRYGKIVKLFFSRRANPPPLGATSASSSSSILTPSSSAASTSNSHAFYTPVNVYINYSRAEEATVCINAIDGTVTPDGHKLKAIWGTTRYCPAYLRGVKCLNDNCMQAHEPGEEIESNTHPGGGTNGSNGNGQNYPFPSPSPYGGQYRFEGTESGRSNNTAIKETREEMVNLKHAYKEQQEKATSSGAAPGLPATASWASKPAPGTVQQATPPVPFPQSFSSNDPRPSASTSGYHAPSSSISSRLPKAQNHPLPARPASRTASHVDAIGKTRMAASKEKERESPKEPSTKAEEEKENNKPAEMVKASKAIAMEQQQEQSSFASTDNLASSSTSTVIAPPTPPLTDPSASTSSLSSAPSLPPGLSLPGLGLPNRPLTPLSEFDRTLDTFGDGMSFAFNLSSSPGSLKGKERLMDGSELAPGSFNFDESLVNSATQSSRTSRSGSPEPLNGGKLAYEEEEARYHGPFDPFSSSTATAMPSSSEQDFGMGSAPPPGFGGMNAPPGLSRANTASPATDGGSMSKPPGLSGPSVEDTPTLGGRHRSRFGFARSGSAERGASSGMGSASGSSTGIPIAVSELFKGVTGMPQSSTTPASSLPSGLVNGRASPNRPSSATSSASGGLPFSLPPGVFAPSSGSGSVASAFGAPALPPAFASSSELPLPPPDPSKQARDAKKSLSDLFPGVDLAASFSSSNALPPSLVKSLGISLESLDMQATAAANGKLPNFAPMPLGHGNSIANQPLPPPPTASSSSSGSANGFISSGGGPPGLGASRQAQQAHAQHAQQAHQAQMAAQQAAQAAQAAQQQAAQAAREQQQQQQHHGRPPSAASVGSAGKGDMYGYMGLQNATSPPLPQTPAGFGDAARFQDPAIISYAGMNGYGHHQHNPYAAMHGFHPHHHPEHPSPGTPGAGGGQGEYYNRYHPLPTPVQPQQTYNPYIPVAPVGLAGMGRLQAAQMSQAGAFGLLRR